VGRRSLWEAVAGNVAGELMSERILTPSTTRILGDMGLVPDFDAIAARNPRVIEARDRGHRIHGYCEFLFTGAYNDHASSATDDEIKVALALAQWYDSHGYDVIRVEGRLYHRSLNYNGQPDHILLHRQSQRYAVADLKTGTQKCAGHRLQAAGYCELFLDAEHDRTGHRSSRVDVDLIIVYANTVRIEVDRVPMQDHLVAWFEFERAIHLWHFRQRHGLLPTPKTQPTDQPVEWVTGENFAS
jgi:hypothetical protein